MSETLYQHATVKMREIIDIMLNLSQETANFHNPTAEHFADLDKATILLCGKGYQISDVPDSVNARQNLWLGRAAIEFGLERSATSLLYKKYNHLSTLSFLRHLNKPIILMMLPRSG